MARKIVLSLAALTLGATSFVAASPTGNAAGTVTVTSPSCGTLVYRNATSWPYVIVTDAGSTVRVPANSSVRHTGLTGGPRYWIAGPDYSEFEIGMGRVEVAACPGRPSRPVDGDQNGDGKADVLGIHVSGDMYYYRMTNTGLADGIKAGRGWSRMVFMQQVNEIAGQGTPNYVFGIHDEGSLWVYPNNGQGKLGEGRPIATNLQGYDNFTITQLNSNIHFGGHVLLARKGDKLYGFDLSATGISAARELSDGWGHTVKTIAVRDFNGDNAGDVIQVQDDGRMLLRRVYDYDGEMTLFRPAVQIGKGWGQMGTVTSPGSINGDRFSDLVARNTNGNLYKYVNGGGRWTEGIQIGRNWNEIRLLA